MDNNSVDTLLDWLKEKPRTLGWGAILAYGRSETNKMLLQEYITRFSSGDFMQPITEEIRDNTTPTHKDFLHNYQMDAPRLSFAGSKLQKSSAKLTMKEVGGTHLSFSKQEGAQQWSLTRVSEKDVLDGPGLKFDIDLMTSTGSVTSAGRVELDISNGSDYRLIDMPSEHLQRVAGERFHDHFKGLPQAQRVFVLNDLRFEPDQFLKPSKFHIRTRSKKESGVSLLADEDEGEGEVLLFVAMEGDGNGTVPIDNADLRYLLPEGHSATVLLGSEMLFKKIIAEGVRRTHTLEDAFRAEFETVNGFTEMIGFGGKGKYAEHFYDGTPTADRYIKFIQVVSLITNFSDHGGGPQPGLASFRVRREAGEIVLDWRGTKEQSCIIFYSTFPPTISGNLGSAWECVWRFKYKLEPQTGRIMLAVDESNELFKVDVSVGTYQDQPLLIQDFPRIKASFEGMIAPFLRQTIETFISPTTEINVFTLNSLLFRNEDAVRFDSVHCPGDMAAFGHVGPRQSAFSITELEPIIPHTVAHTFTTEPRRNDLTWSVRNILGETVPKGTITNTGVYTPPTDAQIQRSSVRVVITATDGTHTSSALVSVTKRSLSVNPLIMIATAGDSLGHDVSAGAVDGGRLDWSIQDPASGAEVRPNPAEGKDHSYVPGPAISKSSPTVDTIVVTNPRTGVSETTSVLVLHRQAILHVVINEAVTLPENQLQLSIIGDDGPINPGDWNEQWQVLLGGGSAQINATTGLLTLNPAGPDKFVVITVLAPPARPGGASDDGYIILPLPLFSVPETVRMLRDNP
ncbi:hypothetical protein BK652_04960 [Pseudomonas brassicacearum]|uniref:Uncharacterized protein n=1 Tax=Pseudomonas brassicacearum TaxID=930166 RepID=A0A423GFJ0_9PSED|nr:hypothetical protein [Pseudomonas brassicacearum]ROM85929.1 hypothetical protein BK652_04960 [Pseudomonas brassicacearum]